MTYSSLKSSAKPTVFRVNALWDAEAEVYVATSDDIPGLVVEAGTFEELMADLRAVVPELLELNKVPHTWPVRLNLTTTEDIESAA